MESDRCCGSRERFRLPRTTITAATTTAKTTAEVTLAAIISVEEDSSSAVSFGASRGASEFGGASEMFGGAPVTTGDPVRAAVVEVGTEVDDSEVGGAGDCGWGVGGIEVELDGVVGAGEVGGCVAGVEVAGEKVPVEVDGTTGAHVTSMLTA
jgi:hypothetical protein